MEQNNSRVERIRALSTLEFTQEEIGMLELVTERLDRLKYSFERKDRRREVEAINEPHRLLNELLVAISIPALLKDIKK